MEMNGSRWSYYLIPSNGNANASAYDTWQPLTGFSKILVEDGFQRHRFMVTDDRVALTWNKNEIHPPSDLANAGLAVVFTVPASGTWSLAGELAWRSVLPSPLTKGAKIEIGVLRAGETTPRILFNCSLQASDRFETPEQLEGFRENSTLQNLRLEAGDRLVWIWRSASQNYRGIEGLDGAMRLVHKEGEPFTDARESASIQRLLKELDPKLIPDLQPLFHEKRYSEAMSVLVKHIGQRFAALPPEEKFDYWLFNGATANELLEGNLTISHYGQKGRTTYRIGTPGSTEWFTIPPDGYATAVRDISTLQWSTKLAEAYAKTGDSQARDAFLGYWRDFAENWRSGFQERMKNPEFKSLVNGTIGWASGSRLYNAWRLDSLTSGLAMIFARARQDETIDQIDPAAMASILSHVLNWEAPRSFEFLKKGGGVPNQQQHLAGGLFTTGVVFDFLPGASAWRQSALDTILEKSGFLPDGTDIEQSLNYNKHLEEKLEPFLTASSALPESDQGPVRNRLNDMNKARYSFLHGIVMPNGAQPIIGKNNTWRDFGKDTQQLPGITDGEAWKRMGQNSISAFVKDRFYGPAELPDPAFRSIIFPYGGYVALRSGWDRDALYAFMKISRPGRGHMGEENNAAVFSAYGRNLLVNSGRNDYNPDTFLKQYGRSSIGQNTIAVDGFGQSLMDGSNPPMTYDSPMRLRFLDGKAFSFAEGRYEGAYGGWNFQNPEAKGVIRDVNHTRQILQLHEEKIWIVTDIVESSSEHTFTQIWNFPPDISASQIEVDGQGIRTTQPGAVNIDLHQFSDHSLTQSKFYGSSENGITLGWVAMDDPKTDFDATPAVDTHSSWRSKGRSVLVTVIVPHRGESPLASIKPTRDGEAKGVEIQWHDGSTATYLHGGRDGEAYLKTDKATFFLQPDGGYEETSEGMRTQVVIPEGFRWVSSGGTETPDYRKSE